MHPTLKPAVYRTPLSPSEIVAAKVRLLAQGEVDLPRFTGYLTAILFLLSLEPVGQTAWELIREAQADIAAYNALIEERHARWHYNRDDAPEETSLGLNDVDGYAVGRWA